jgi:Putative zinc-finger
LSPEKKVPLLGLSCREASRLISESMDRELSRREKWALRLHTILCAACRRFAQQVTLIRQVIANMPNDLRENWSNSSAKLSTERRAQIKRLLSEARRADFQD